MSIATPRYALPPPILLARRNRPLAILRQEFVRRLREISVIFLSLAYVVVLLPVVLGFYLRALIPGVVTGPALGLFDEPYSLGVSFVFLVLLTSTVGAAIIAGDVSTRAITLYLSRPISRADYLLGKAGAVGLWLALGTIGPGAVAATIVLSLGYISLSVGLNAIVGYVILGLLSTIAFTGIALALSALASRSVLAGAGIFGLLLGSEVIASVFSSASGRSSFLYLSPNELVNAVARAAFGVGGTPIDPWISGALLLLLGIGGGLLAYLRLGREEVVSE